MPRPVAGVALTHPDRVLWPEAGVTKRDLAAYLERIAPRLLPHVAGRPLTLVRCPGGTGTKCFFARRPWAGMNPAIERARAGEDAVVAVRDAAGLVALAQSGVIEIHPWGSTLDDPERPDRLVVDLDPAPDVGAGALREAALEVRVRVEALGLVPFLKSTGGKGLHVVAPIVPDLAWDDLLDVARDLAEGLERDRPERFTHGSRKDERAGRIFVDYLRNGRGATAIAPYSPRARAGASLAVPLAWEALDDPRPGAAAITTLPQRLGPDPWARFAGAARRLRAA